MKTINFFLLFLIIGVASGCSNDNKGGADEKYIGNFALDLRMETPQGNNLADSLQVTDDKTFFTPFNPESGKDITIHSIRNSDGKEMEIFKCGWANYHLIIKEDVIDSFNPDEIHALGRILELYWTDHDVWDRYRKPVNYDESYTVLLTSKKFFGTDEPQKIQCYIHVNGIQYRAYRYELNGKKVETDKDQKFFTLSADPDTLPCYNLDKFIRIPCK